MCLVNSYCILIVKLFLQNQIQSRTNAYICSFYLISETLAAVCSSTFLTGDQNCLATFPQWLIFATLHYYSLPIRVVCVVVLGGGGKLISDEQKNDCTYSRCCWKLEKSWFTIVREDVDLHLLCCYSSNSIPQFREYLFIWLKTFYKHSRGLHKLQQYCIYW